MLIDFQGIKKEFFESKENVKSIVEKKKNNKNIKKTIRFRPII